MNSKLQIIVLENEPSSRRGGQELSLLDVCRGLALRGHWINLVYTKEGDLLDEYREFCRSLIRVGGYAVDRAATINTLAKMLWDLARLSCKDIDIIYFNQYLDALFAGMLARLKRVPLVCHLRLFPPERFCGQWRTGLPAVTRFIAVSEATRSAYICAGFSPDIIDVVHNGISLDFFSMRNDRDATREMLGIPLNAFVVIYVGRIDRQKNIEMIFHAFSMLALPLEKARIVVVGGPLAHATKQAGEQYIEELQTLAKILGIGNQVHWLGRRNDTPRLFRAADVSVLPSKLPETFGRTLAESMACGTPAIGLKHSGIPEVLSGEFRKFCVDVDDIEGMVALLSSLRNWQSGDPELGIRCRKHVEERFGAKHMVDGVHGVLQRAVRAEHLRAGPQAAALKAWRYDVDPRNTLTDASSGLPVKTTGTDCKL